MNIIQYKCGKKLIILFFIYIFCFFCYPAVSEDVQVEGYEYRLDIPAGWELYDAEDLSRVSFTDPTHSVVLQVFVYPGDQFSKSSEIFETVKSQLKAEGDGENFLFNMKDSYLAELHFFAGKLEVKGYFVFINSTDCDYMICCFTSIDLYDSYLAFIFSAIDSFSLNEEGLLYPGPISQVFYPFPGPEQEKHVITFHKNTFPLMVDKNEFEASQLMIEIEANVLAAYEKDQNGLKAWERFFRMIYRDTYHRLDKLYETLEIELQKQGQNKKEMITSILSWIQDYEYTRTESIADFLSPLTAAVKHEGDCDSRAMLYLILLHQMGADAVLLVSTQYDHSAVGLDYNILKKQGASIEFEGKNYLYAELTASVDIGMIAKDFSDPSGWIPIRLGNYAIKTK